MAHCDVVKNVLPPSNETHVFNNLLEKNMQSLLAHAKVKTFPSKTTLVRQYTFPKYLYFILSGEVKTTRLNHNGDETTIRMLTKGETFMEAMLFIDSLSPINAETITKSELLLIPAESVKSHAQSDMQFALNLLKVFSLYYKNMMVKLDDFMLKTPLERVGRYLLREQIKSFPELCFNLPFKKTVIANYLGMTPETFSRSLHQLKQCGITVEKSIVSIADTQVLCQFCDDEVLSSCPCFKKRHCKFKYDKPQ